MKKFLILSLLVLFALFLISCNDTPKQTNPVTDNISVTNAIKVLNSCVSNTDIYVSIEGEVNQKILNSFKAAFNLLQGKVQQGFLSNVSLSIDMSDITGISALDVAFFNNITILKEVKLPNCITEIEKYTFYGCKNIKEITIPENVRYIGCGAFADCTALKELNIKSKTLELSQSCFENVKDIVINAEDTKLYFFESTPFDLSCLNLFAKYLPTENLSVSKAALSERGLETKYNLNISYSSDSDCIYMKAINNDTGDTSFNKILVYLKNSEVSIDTSDTDIDGIIPYLCNNSYQKLKITSPTDGSVWYYTTKDGVFFSRNTEEAIAIRNDQTISMSRNSVFYFFKVSGGNK